jgi:hypothetical protein
MDWILLWLRAGMSWEPVRGQTIWASGVLDARRNRGVVMRIPTSLPFFFFFFLSISDWT